jgi:CopA family copper-resistance protein
MKNFFLILIHVFLAIAVSAQSTRVIYTCVMHPEVQKDKAGDCPKCGMTLIKKTVKVSTPKTSGPGKQEQPKTKTPQPAQGNAHNGMYNVEQGQREKQPESITTYTCVMHPEVQKDKPGNCPKCGMKLIKKTVKVESSKAASSNQEPDSKTIQPVQQDRNSNSSNPKQELKQEQLQTKTVYTCVMHPEVQKDTRGNCPKCGMTLIRKTIQVGGQNTTGKKEQNSQSEQESLPHDHEESEQGNAAVTFVGSKVDMQTGKTVVYHLYVTDTTVNYTGKNKHGYAINGSIPAPTLYFTEGDTAEIWLHNRLKKEETSLHWHGVILPNRFDGVPYLTTKRIGPGDTYVYKFKVVQNGTYWYHSHSALQEQSGMYGALIFKKKETPAASEQNTDSANHLNVVLSEWADDDPTQIQRRLRTANDWFSIKKRSTQSYSEAIKEGRLQTKLLNEWKRMKAMDVSDIFYDRFLVNGKPEAAAQTFKAGDKVNLHVVNAGASSYFWLNYGGGKITVVGNDGNDLMPVEVDRLIIAPAETYDLVVTIPQNMSYEFRATSEDRTGASSLWLGTGMKMPARKYPRLNYFEGMKMMNDMMNTNGTMKDMGMNMSLQQMDMNMVMYPEITGTMDDNNIKKTKNSASGAKVTGVDANTSAGGMNHNHGNASGMNSEDTTGDSDIVTLNYAMLRSPVNTSLPDGPMKVLHFKLTGNMNRYVWTIDNETVNEADRILIRKGENVRVILTNNSMMRHPMHLHGHDFRVVNRHGDYAPLKNVLDIMPMETDTIEFAANQEGNWFFHCHILYHMMAGMGKVFTYANSPVNPDLPDPGKAYRLFKKDNTMKHLMARIGLESNGSHGEAMLSTNRYALISEWRIGSRRHHGLESETMFGKFIGVNQWLFPYVGFDYHRNELENETEKNYFGQISNQNNRRTFTAGVQYITPWLLLADARIDAKGKFRFELSREDIPITPRLRLGFMANTDKEYMGGFRYILNKWSALSTHYDSDMGFGAGITITY